MGYWFTERNFQIFEYNSTLSSSWNQFPVPSSATGKKMIFIRRNVREIISRFLGRIAKCMSNINQIYINITFTFFTTLWHIAACRYRISLRVFNLISHEWAALRGCRDGAGSCRHGAVVGALASLHCGPGSIPGPFVTCGLSLLFVLVPAPRVVLRVLRFSFPPKNTKTLQTPIPSVHLIITSC